MARSEISLYEQIRWVTDECRMIMDGTHPMYDKQIVLAQLNQIKAMAEKYGISIKDKTLRQLVAEISNRENK